MVSVVTVLYRSIIELYLPFYTFSGFAFPYSRHVSVERRLFIREHARMRACEHSLDKDVSRLTASRRNSL